MAPLEGDPMLCVLCPVGTDPHPFADHIVARERKVARYSEPVIERVINLWNNEGGWIPGAAYRQLAEALGVSPDRLIHWDTTTGRHNYPVPYKDRGATSDE